MLAAEAAILARLELVRLLLLVPGRAVIAPLALAALERDDLSHVGPSRPRRACSKIRKKPKTRIELVTPSLPRTCSTN